MAGNLGSSRANTWMYVVDVHNPATAHVIGSVSFFGVVRRLAVSGNSVFAAADDGALQVVDVTDPTQPVLGARNYDFNPVRDLALSGGAVVSVRTMRCATRFMASSAPSLAPLTEIAAASDRPTRSSSAIFTD